MILPFGTPPRPSAISRLKEPVGMVSTFMFAAESPSFMTAPFPYCFSICPSAASSARSLSSLLFPILNILLTMRTSVRFCIHTITNLLCCQLFFFFSCVFFQPPNPLHRSCFEYILMHKCSIFHSPAATQKYCKKIPKRLFFPLLPFRDFFLIFQNADQLIRSASCTFPRTVLRNSPRRNPVPLRGRSSCSTRVFCRNRCALRTARYPSSHAHCSL